MADLCAVVKAAKAMWDRAVELEAAEGNLKAEMMRHELLVRNLRGTVDESRKAFDKASDNLLEVNRKYRSGVVEVEPGQQQIT